MKATAVKEKPILFSSEMVRAILDGRKTQTRRIVKLEDGLFRDTQAYTMLDPEVDWQRDVMACDCPYGSRGGHLWIRESFRFTEDIDGREVLDFRCGGTRLIARNGDGLPSAVHGEHRATSILPKWKPSIHMPRWASRITLEITDVRVERVQSISEDDAKAEGCDGNCGIGSIPAYQAGPCAYHFASLWNKINGAGSWEANPFVWAITFRRLEAPCVE